MVAKNEKNIFGKKFDANFSVSLSSCPQTPAQVDKWPLSFWTVIGKNMSSLDKDDTENGL